MVFLGQFNDTNYIYKYVHTQIEGQSDAFSPIFLIFSFIFLTKNVASKKMNGKMLFYTFIYLSLSSFGQ